MKHTSALGDSIIQPGLYLVLELDENTDASQLAGAIDAAKWQSALLLGSFASAPAVATAKTIVTGLQKRGTAVLVAGDAAAVVALKADGLHLAASKNVAAVYREARKTLGPAAIIGADAGRSRHDAMELGEGGADYIAFGIPPHVTGRDIARERQLELIAWWSDVFEPPCVAMDVETADHARALANAGADFIAITVSFGGLSPGVADVQAFTGAIARGHQIA